MGPSAPAARLPGDLRPRTDPGSPVGQDPFGLVHGQAQEDRLAATGGVAPLHDLIQRGLGDGPGVATPRNDLELDYPDRPLVLDHQVRPPAAPVELRLRPDPGPQEEAEQGGAEQPFAELDTRSLFRIFWRAAWS